MIGAVPGARKTSFSFHALTHSISYSYTTRKYVNTLITRQTIPHDHSRYQNDWQRFDFISLIRIMCCTHRVRAAVPAMTSPSVNLPDVNDPRVSSFHESFNTFALQSPS